MPSPPEWKSDGFFVLIKARDMTTGDWSWRRAERSEFAAILDAALAAEREACAKIAEDYYRKSTFSSRVRSLGQDAADGIAAAIRNRVQ